MSRLTCVVGISGSGKSYYSNLLAAKIGGKIVSSDAIRKEVTGNTSDMTKDGYIWGKLIPSRIFAGLANHGDVVFDATGVARRARKSIIELGMDGGAEVHCHFFEPDLERAKRQNAQRERVIPTEIIERQFKNWQEPLVSEGFDRVLNIDATIREWQRHSDEVYEKFEMGRMERLVWTLDSFVEYWSYDSRDIKWL